MAPEGYLRSVLADGDRVFRPRAGVRELLGVPEDTGVRVSFPVLPRGAGFVYRRETASALAAAPPAPGWQVQVVDDPAHFLGTQGAPARPAAADMLAPARAADVTDPWDADPWDAGTMNTEGGIAGAWTSDVANTAAPAGGIASTGGWNTVEVTVPGVTPPPVAAIEAPVRSSRPAPLARPDGAPAAGPASAAPASVTPPGVVHWPDAGPPASATPPGAVHSPAAGPPRVDPVEIPALRGPRAPSTHAPRAADPTAGPDRRLPKAAPIPPAGRATPATRSAPAPVAPPRPARSIPLSETDYQEGDLRATTFPGPNSVVASRPAAPMKAAIDLRNAPRPAEPTLTSPFPAPPPRGPASAAPGPAATPPPLPSPAPAPAGLPNPAPAAFWQRRHVGLLRSRNLR